MDSKLTEKVIKNNHGYYELQDIYRKPIVDFYEDKYYQNDHATYQKKGYDKIDLDYRNNIFSQKMLVLEKWGRYKTKPSSFLDIGCGEGFALAFLRTQGGTFVA